MSILYLHIGGPKTGSTYLQSVFRINRSSLLDMGIYYPTGNECPDKTPTSWTYGNGAGILDSAEALAKALGKINDYPGSSMLYSHEGLRNDVCIREKVALIPSIARAHGFTHIKFLFFVRNPVAYTVSVWQQLVKQNGMHEALDDRIRNPDFMNQNYTKTQNILELLSEDPIFELTALNYCHCSDRLLDIAIDWLDIQKKKIEVPEASWINRSLTRAELTLQMAMNRVLGGDAKIVAKALTENLTDIRPEKIVPSPDAQQILWNRLEPSILRANRYLAKGHEIIFDRQEPEEKVSDQFTFSEAQLEIIGRVLAEEIRNLRYPYIPPTPPPLMTKAWRKIKAGLFK